ncbi:hypothetical protein AMTR_s00029p00219690 [Amborella trichopoda]|uniref:Uncharacterized protein n=1 Tax=Amborella trichopoda TaxID=13333 RepID=W1PIB1_AMBTC|nr:hypothetical protein AMTR_s00029p00219690 [Amborella trichopoda]
MGEMITKFIYYSLVLALTRQFTNGRNLISPSITRFATSFLSMNSILKVIINASAIGCLVTLGKYSFFKDLGCKGSSSDNHDFMIKSFGTVVSKYFQRDSLSSTSGSIYESFT